jgi:hypothetical protein
MPADERRKAIGALLAIDRFSLMRINRPNIKTLTVIDKKALMI